MQTRLAQKVAWLHARFAGRFEIADNQVGRRSGERDVEEAPFVFDRCTLVRNKAFIATGEDHRVPLKPLCFEVGGEGNPALLFPCFCFFCPL